MVSRPKRVKVTPDSDLARLLEEASAGPLLLEQDGEVYRLEREAVELEKEDIWAGYDPEKVREAIAETAGSWADVDAEALIAHVYRAREEGSRPATRPRVVSPRRRLGNQRARKETPGG